MTKTKNHPVEVSEEAGVRYLHFGSDWIQGAMRIRRPNALELAYTREMMACLLLRPDPYWPRRALLIGLGAASLTKFFYHYLPQTETTVIEINPQVVAVARQCFKLPEETPGRFALEIAEGAQWLAECAKAFDVILVDGFDADARAGGLDTAAFYANCREHLAPEGLLAVNLLGRSRGFAASAQRIAEAFDGRSLVFPSCDSGNTIAFAAIGSLIEQDTHSLKESARRLRTNTGLNLLPTLARLAEAGFLSGGRLLL